MPMPIEARTATHGRASADTRDVAPLSAAGLPAHAVGYRALKLWQRALDVAADVHRLSRTFPVGEQEGLGGELRRAAAAVPAAVAAGSLASDRSDHQRALQSAAAAVARVETLTALAERLDFVATRDTIAVLAGTGDVTRLLRGLTRFLAARGEAGRTVAEFDAAGGRGTRPGIARVRDPVAGDDERASTPAAAAAGAAAEPAPVAGVSPVAPPSMRRRGAGSRSVRVRPGSA